MPFCFVQDEDRGNLSLLKEGKYPLLNLLEKIDLAEFRLLAQPAGQPPVKIHHRSRVVADDKLIQDGRNEIDPPPAN